jgi:hypothetical protein
VNEYSTVLSWRSRAVMQIFELCASMVISVADTDMAMMLKCDLDPRI